MHGKDVKPLVENGDSKVLRDRIMIGTMDNLTEIKEQPPAIRLEDVDLV